MDHLLINMEKKKVKKCFGSACGGSSCLSTIGGVPVCVCRYNRLFYLLQGMHRHQSCNIVATEVALELTLTHGSYVQ